MYKVRHILNACAACNPTKKLYLRNGVLVLRALPKWRPSWCKCRRVDQ